MTTKVEESPPTRKGGPPRKGSLESYRDASGKRHWRGRIRLADGSRERILVPDDITTKERARDYVTARQVAEVETGTFLAAKRTKIARRAGAPLPASETCDEWFERFNAWQIEQGKTSARDARYAWNSWIHPKIGAKPLAAVTRGDVEDIRDALDRAIDAWKRDGKGSGRISGKSGMNIWSTLTSALKAATSSKRRELRTPDGKPNPCLGVEPPGDRESRKPRRKSFLYPKEAAALFACNAIPLEWRELHAVAAMTFLRPGELRVLTWSAVDSEAGIISVTEAWDYAEEKTKAPKTRNGIRSVPIAPALAPLLARMRGCAATRGRPILSCRSSRR